MARNLHNLAQLLQATDRLDDAKPLMRRALGILLRVTAVTGHQHPHVQTMTSSYENLLERLGLPRDRIRAGLDELVDG